MWWGRRQRAPCDLSKQTSGSLCFHRDVVGKTNSRQVPAGARKLARSTPGFSFSSGLGDKGPVRMAARRAGQASALPEPAPGVPSSFPALVPSDHAERAFRPAFSECPILSGPGEEKMSKAWSLILEDFAIHQGATRMSHTCV